MATIVNIREILTFVDLVFSLFSEVYIRLPKNLLSE